MRIVLANGCFDPLHAGHILHLRAASLMGDRLIVGVTDDEHVRIEKGVARPALSAQIRREIMRELRCVYQVLIVSGAINALEQAAPNVFVKGSDYIGRIGADVEAYCAARHIDIKFTRTPKFSATALLHELRRG